MLGFLGVGDGRTRHFTVGLSVPNNVVGQAGQFERNRAECALVHADPDFARTVARPEWGLVPVWGIFKKTINFY